MTRLRSSARQSLFHLLSSVSAGVPEWICSACTGDGDYRDLMVRLSDSRRAAGATPRGVPLAVI